ncbi:MAG TPA: MurR/RpiR family transcriptional regulator [Paracoccaceae bacterium]|nr:MurR/RpiR family transcriptional regulator [Paracoccaceae bacterium]
MGKVIDIITRLRTSDGRLSKREQLVADFILTHLEEVATLNQHQIAEATGVSVATVNRLCTSVGCEGFRDFKIALAQNVAVSLQYLGGPTADTSGGGQLIAQVFGALLESLTLARTQLEGQPIEEITAILGQARRIVFLGVGGGSANVAREGANRFFRLGIPSEAHADGYLQRMVAATLGKGDVVLAISSSGQPAELLDSVSVARQYGARTISLTRSGSELAALTDLSIQIDIPEDQDIYKPSASRLVYIAIIDVLAAGAARKRPDAVKDYLRRIRTSLAPLSRDTGPSPIGD